MEPQDTARIASPRLWARHVLDPVTFPETFGTAERLETALGADPGSGENDHSRHASPLHIRPGSPQVLRIGGAECVEAVVV